MEGIGSFDVEHCRHVSRYNELIACVLISVIEDLTAEVKERT